MIDTVWHSISQNKELYLLLLGVYLAVTIFLKQALSVYVLRKHLKKLRVSQYSTINTDEAAFRKASLVQYKSTPPFFWSLLSFGKFEKLFTSTSMRLLYERLGWRYPRHGGVYLKIMVLIYLLLLPLTFIGLDFLAKLSDFTKLMSWLTLVMLSALLYKPVLSSIVEKKAEELEEGFVSFCEIMTIPLNAGFGLESALSKTLENVATTDEQLKKFILQLITEFKYADYDTGLENFYKRLPTDFVKDFVIVAKQSKRQGSSLVDSLIEMIETHKKSVFNKMEHKAQTVPVKITLLTALLFFPAMFVFLLAPIFSRFL